MNQVPAFLTNGSNIFDIVEFSNMTDVMIFPQ